MVAVIGGQGAEMVSWLKVQLPVFGKDSKKAKLGFFGDAIYSRLAIC